MTISEFPKRPLPHLPPRQEPRVAPVPAPTVFVYEKQEWEYKVISRNSDTEALPDEAELNALGKDGWELVSIVTVVNNVRFYLKRIRN